ncbi:MAG: hypothetical protein N2378_02650 [Chloroflexaceae bacterium]|nr:hypothetical protein [Chloroflexaceae bacterium]
MKQADCRKGRIGRVALLVALLAALLGTLPAVAQEGPTAGPVGDEALPQQGGGQIVFLPVVSRPRANVQLTLRPVPLQQVQRATILSVEFRLANVDRIVAPSTLVSLFYSSRLTIFTETALAPGDAQVSFDDTRVTVRVNNVAPGETRTGRINFFVRRDAPIGDRIPLYATFECPARNCRTGLVQVEIIRNEEEGVGGVFNLSVSPDRGPPGTAHVFTGDFFSPGEEIVTWLNTETDVVPLDITTTADGAGRIRIVFGTGELAPGFYSLVAHGERSDITGVGAFIVTGPGVP